MPLPAAPIAVSIKRAAELLCVTRPTIRAWIAEGRLRRFDLGEHTARIPMSDIEALVGGDTGALATKDGET